MKEWRFTWQRVGGGLEQRTWACVAEHLGRRAQVEAFKEVELGVRRMIVRNVHLVLVEALKKRL